MEVGPNTSGKPFFWRNGAGMKPVDSKQITKTIKRFESDAARIIEKGRKMEIDWRTGEKAKP